MKRIVSLGTGTYSGELLAAAAVQSALEVLGHRAKFIPTSRAGANVSGRAVETSFRDMPLEKSLDRLQAELRGDEAWAVIEGGSNLDDPVESTITHAVMAACSPHAIVVCVDVQDPVRSSPGYVSRAVEKFLAMASGEFPVYVAALCLHSSNTNPTVVSSVRRGLNKLGYPVVDSDDPESVSTILIPRMTRVS